MNNNDNIILKNIDESLNELDRMIRQIASRIEKIEHTCDCLGHSVYSLEKKVSDISRIQKINNDSSVNACIYRIEFKLQKLLEKMEESNERSD